MNLASHLSGCWDVLRPASRHAAKNTPPDDNNWQEKFDLTRRGLWQSYLIVLLTIPAYYMCALAIASERAQIDGTPPALISPAIFSVAALLYSLTFSASIYLITLCFNKPAHFRPWAIVRHWSVFFCVGLAASVYGLSLISPLPILFADILALSLYLATLAIDIRLAYKLGEFDFAASIFTGCIIFAMGLSVLLMSVVQIGASI